MASGSAFALAVSGLATLVLAVRSNRFRVVHSPGVRRKPGPVRRAIKILSIIDEYTRECITLNVSRKMTSEDVIAVLVDLIAIRGVPTFVRCDNGPEFISRPLRKFLERIDVGTSYIEPGSPWENGFVESFHSRFRDECLAYEEFTTISEATTVIDQWRMMYNQRRPHSSLGGLTPAKFALQCAASVPGEIPPSAPSLLPLQRHTAD